MAEVYKDLKNMMDAVKVNMGQLKTEPADQPPKQPKVIKFNQWKKIIEESKEEEWVKEVQ